MLGLPHVDDDEDNHLCIKCNMTIIGLDNYVKHRKSMCGKNKLQINITSDGLDQIKHEDVKALSESTIGPFHEGREYNLGADVFFQSLELQSSFKKPTVTIAPPISIGSKSGAGVLTRRATAAMLATNFPGKEIYGSNESYSNVVSNKRGEDWIGGHNLKVTGTDDNQTKLIKAVANICETVKKEPTQPSFAIIDDYKHDDDSRDLSDDSDDMDDEVHSHSVEKWKPSPSHTGGKWKPIFGGRDSATHWTSVTPITPEPDNNEDWEEEYTGGKWKPIMLQENVSRLEKNIEIDEDEDDAYMPPPGHTKGKWIPGAKENVKNDYKIQIMDAMALHKEGSSVQYWCGPCNRRLGSRNIYEKHLMSNLHLKRTLPEKELEYSGSFRPSISVSDTSKRTIKPSLYLDESIYLSKKINKKSTDAEKKAVVLMTKRKRRSTLMICFVCKCKVKPFLMGKHLISHYHFRKSNMNDEINRQQILNNICRIIRQSPFQCSPCKFYTNWQSDFLKHWQSTSHNITTENLRGKYWCSFCKFETKHSSSMEEHLLGDNHQEVIAVINRSMPIIIRKKSIICCSNCGKKFRYNIQLKRHNRMHCKAATSSTASDEYQETKKCSQCSYVCKSKINLSRHILRRHSRKMYFCSACSLEFPSAKEARVHRSLQSHRIKEKEQRREKGFEVKDMSKACSHCDAPRFSNIIELKKHIQQQHKEVFTSCPQCGKKFTLPQEVTWHIRNKACTFEENILPQYSNVEMWNCRICPFITPSHAECIFHEVLHGDPITEESSKNEKERSSEKYGCPVCQKIFTKPSLRWHLRQHTNERPHVCAICNSGFSRKSNLIFHVKRMHSDGQKSGEEYLSAPPVIKKPDKGDDAPKRFLCSMCGAGFSKKYSLKQHLTRHTGRTHACPIAGCLYSGRSQSELRAHAAAHSSARPHRCKHCSYAAKTAVQLTRHNKVHSGDREKKAQCPHCPYKADHPARLERHLRLHTGDKPYACRYCSFTCNNLENLRKHVLSRNKHKNKYLYECEHCKLPGKYGTNFAKDFRIHLTKEHPTAYPDHKSTANYVSNYLKTDNAKIEQANSCNLLLAYCVFNVDGTKLSLLSSSTVKFDGPFQTHDANDQMDFTKPNENTILEEFPTEGCYSVTETGSLVPYMEAE